ncbi:MAG: hypothetical protein EOM37_00065 [Proteobacteria bacterium]|nr:hypothetical protein [Alphaproteobacteria bacterium]NCC02433.1 hypothetical protein [Pseudomonadota bacterium]
MTTNEKTNDAVYEMTEDQIKTLVRNSLLVAGRELGENGDHWPVIKNTITGIMLDWEKLAHEREVQAEMKKHLYDQLHEMERILETAPEEEKVIAAPALAELREIYDAYFSQVDREEIAMTDEELEAEGYEKPMHIRRAEAIIEEMMEEDNV